jgi:LL-diaminopimelate aminotransferase
MAAARALQLGPEWYAQLNAVYDARRKRVYDLLDAIGCTYSTGQCGLFVWAKVTPAFRDGYECSDHVLGTSRVFITPGGIFGSAGNEYVRLSLCATEEKIIDAVKRIQV